MPVAINKSDDDLPIMRTDDRLPLHDHETRLIHSNKHKYVEQSLSSHCKLLLLLRDKSEANAFL